ncbi:hypothetical protein [Methanoculleus sp.]|jgi:hypothetical protein|uniref:hypothetical protein n=1 Tax=Methanoculleus sp. TaxID=90427 RepID=UPI001BD25B67|nr:hypothetical protein [Methanoculleus sp.]
MRRSHAAIPLIAGCIGAAILVFMLSPSVCGAVFPNPSVTGSSPGETPETGEVSGTGAGNVSPLISGQATGDAELTSLIAGNSVPLLELSVEQIHYLYTKDNAPLRIRASETCSLAERLRAEVLALEISPENESARSHFIAALDEFAAAGTLFSRGVPTDQNVADDALEHLALGTEYLSDALQDCSRPSNGSQDTMTVSANPAEKEVPELPDALQPGERFCYDDTRGENTVSLIIDRATWLHAFRTTGTKPVQYTAGSGMSYLLVVVKATHLGHKGDGVNSRLQTPGVSAFTLHYSGETYRPLASPGQTDRGGSYSGVALNRHESVEGYLFFEVPESLDLSHAYIQANIGKNNPVWLLNGSDSQR